METIINNAAESYCFNNPPANNQIAYEAFKAGVKWHKEFTETHNCVDFHVENKMFVCNECGKKYNTLGVGNENTK